jgi:hypothetical protein
VISRTYAAGHFALELEGQRGPLAGFAEAGGTFTMLWSGATLLNFHKVLADAINAGRAPSTARILAVAYDGRIVQIRELSNIRLANVALEEVGATLKVPAKPQVIATATSKMLPGDGSVVSAANLSTAQNTWLRCHYRLELGVLPTQRISSIGGMTITASGSVSDFLLTVSQVDAAFYREALASGLVTKAVIKYLTPALTTLCSLTCPFARLIKEIPTSIDKRNPQAATAKFQMLAGKVTFNYGA